MVRRARFELASMKSILNIGMSSGESANHNVLLVWKRGNMNLDD